MYLPWSGEDDLITFLKEWYPQVIRRKEDNFLISPAVFDPNRCSETGRGLKNIVYLRHIWLDFEDGDLSPQQIAVLVPNIKMLAMNSYNHTEESPRFRVIIFTTDVLTPDTYTLVFDNIERKLAEAGYWPQSHPLCAEPSPAIGPDSAPASRV
jgi:hypothetical protein